jgi:F-type H+-transporting ATPase subunit b
LAKFAWRPLLQALENRHEMIRKALDDAQQAKQELERIQQQSTEIINKARVEAEAIITRSRADGERLREELKQKARAEAESVMKTAERQIQLETTRAVQQIRREAVDLSVTIASKLLKRNLSREDNEKLIEEALGQLDTPRH